MRSVLIRTATDRPVFRLKLVSKSTHNKLFTGLVQQLLPFSLVKIEVSGRQFAEFLVRVSQKIMYCLVAREYFTCKICNCYPHRRIAEKSIIP